MSQGNAEIPHNDDLPENRTNTDPSNSNVTTRSKTRKEMEERIAAMEEQIATLKNKIETNEIRNNETLEGIKNEIEKNSVETKLSFREMTNGITNLTANMEKVVSASSQQNQNILLVQKQSEDRINNFKIDFDLKMELIPGLIANSMERLLSQLNPGRNEPTVETDNLEDEEEPENNMNENENSANHRMAGAPVARSNLGQRNRSSNRISFGGIHNGGSSTRMYNDDSDQEDSDAEAENEHRNAQATKNFQEEFNRTIDGGLEENLRSLNELPILNKSSYLPVDIKTIFKKGNHLDPWKGDTDERTAAQFVRDFQNTIAYRCPDRQTIGDAFLFYVLDHCKDWANKHRHLTMSPRTLIERFLERFWDTEAQSIEMARLRQQSFENSKFTSVSGYLRYWWDRLPPMGIFTQRSLLKTLKRQVPLEFRCTISEELQEDIIDFSRIEHEIILQERRNKDDAEEKRKQKIISEADKNKKQPTKENTKTDSTPQKNTPTIDTKVTNQNTENKEKAGGKKWKGNNQQNWNKNQSSEVENSAKQSTTPVENSGNNRGGTRGRGRPRGRGRGYQNNNNNKGGLQNIYPADEYGYKDFQEPEPAPTPSTSSQQNIQDQQRDLNAN